jgi:hypothetical protein
MDALFVVNFVQEQVQRSDSLDESALQVFPLLGGNDPRHEIERENLLGTSRIAIDVESDALPKKGRVHSATAIIEIIPGDLLKALRKGFVGFPEASGLRGHLVEVAARVVSAQHAVRLHPDSGEENHRVVLRSKNSIHGFNTSHAWKFLMVP